MHMIWFDFILYFNATVIVKSAAFLLPIEVIFSLEFLHREVRGQGHVQTQEVVVITV